MMWKSKRRELLKMDSGTASHRLRKIIMFDMAEKLGLLQCFRCKQPIADIDQFTIDHKEAWQRASDPLDAFFSLENIAFSHPRCNLGAAIHYRKYASPEEAKRAKAEQHKTQKYLAKKKLWKQRKRAEQKRLGLKVT